MKTFDDIAWALMLTGDRTLAKLGGQHVRGVKPISPDTIGPKTLIKFNAFLKQQGLKEVPKKKERNKALERMIKFKRLKIIRLQKELNELETKKNLEAQAQETSF